MTFAELICRVARRYFEEEAELGVRLSPLAISCDEALELRAATRQWLDRRVFTAIAVPGLESYEDPQTCLSSGERAAQMATDWRNRTDASPGDRILYVSVEVQGRAGGLQDTLRAVGEADLRDEARRWCEDEKGCPLPRPLARGLLSVGLERMSARRFCSFVEALGSGTVTAAGGLLPHLALIPDRRLADDPVVRLAANARWVRWASEGTERTSTRFSPSVQEFRGLLKAVVSEGGGPQALGELDLGVFSTAELDADSARPRNRTERGPARVQPADPGKPTPGRRVPPASPPPAAAQPVDVPPAATAGRPAAREDGVGAPDVGSFAEPHGSIDAPTPDATLAESDRATTSAAPSQARGEPMSDGLAPVGPPSEAGTRPAGAEPVAALRPLRELEGAWSRTIHRHEFGVDEPRMPNGLKLMLSTEPPGGAGVWTFQGGVLRGLLDRPPKSLPEPAGPTLPTEVANLAGRWRHARSRLLDVLAVRAGDAMERLVAAPAVILGMPVVREAAREVVATFAELLSDAPPAGAAVLLNLDTVTLADRTQGCSLVVLSPLHPIWLALWLDRADRLAEATELRENADRAVVSRAVLGPLHAPLLWPGARATLSRLPDVAGLISYGDSPVGIGGDALRRAATLVGRRLLELHPYARRRLRVLLDAADPGAIAEGLLEAFSEAGPDDRLTLFTAVPVGSDSITAAMNEGKLTVEPLPRTAEGRAACRVHASMIVPSSRPVQAPAGESGAWPWRSLENPVASSIAPPAIPGLAGIAAAVAATTGAPSAWVAGEAAADIGALPSANTAEKTAWQVVVASSLIGRPPRGTLVVCRERFIGAEVAVMTQDDRAASGLLVPAFRALGVQDARPSRLGAITRALGQTGVGLIPLDGPTDRRIGSQLLELLLREAVDGAVVVPLTGAERAAFVGFAPDPDGSWAIGLAWSGGLRIVAGYAALAQGLTLQRAERGWEGSLIDGLTRLAGALKGAAEADSVGRSVRELVARATWPSLATEDGSPRIASALTGSDLVPVEVTLVCLLPRDVVATTVGAPVKVRGLPVRILGAEEKLLDRLVAGARRR